jgi:hypothetical protein
MVLIPSIQTAGLGRTDNEFCYQIDRLLMKGTAIHKDDDDDDH